MQSTRKETLGMSEMGMSYIFYGNQFHGGNDEPMDRGIPAEKRIQELARYSGCAISREIWNFHF